VREIFFEMAPNKQQWCEFFRTAAATSRSVLLLPASQGHRAYFEQTPSLSPCHGNIGFPVMDGTRLLGNVAPGRRLHIAEQTVDGARAGVFRYRSRIVSVHTPEGDTDVVCSL
jgi:hypothetical protein